MKYNVVQRKIISMGLMEKTFEIEANSAEEAEALVEQGDAEDFCMNIDYDIEQSEHLDITSEEI